MPQKNDAKCNSTCDNNLGGALRSRNGSDCPRFIAAAPLVSVEPADVVLDAPARITIDYDSAFAGDPSALQIFRSDGRSWVALASTVDTDAGTLSAETTSFGVFVVGWDVDPPRIEGLVLESGLHAAVTDRGAGVDADSIAVTADGVPVSVQYESGVGTLRALGELPEGAAVRVEVADVAGNVATAEGIARARVLERSVSLAQQWNLVGWTGPSTAAGEALAELGDAFGAAFTWDAAGGQFLSYAPQAPIFLNSLTLLRPGDGVWLRLDGGVTSWPQSPWDGARAVELEAGFNLVSWTGPNGTSVEDAVATLGSDVLALFLWDAGTQSFLTYRPTAPSVLNTATTLSHGVGIWINMARAADWNQPAP